MLLHLPLVRLRLILPFIVTLLLFSAIAIGQTNPTAQALPFTQNFSTFDGTVTTYPAGFQGWNVPGALSTTVLTAAPNANQVLYSGQSDASTTPFIGDMVGKIGMLSGSSVKALCLALNTTSVTSGNVQLIYTVATQGQTAGGFIDELDLQYRIGTSGTFTTVTGATYQNDGLSNTNTAVTTGYNAITLYISLPAACTNHANVQLRWIPRNVSGSGTTHPSFSITNISAQALTTTDYYSLATGNLDNTATWGTNTDGTGTNPANFTAASQVFHIANSNPGNLSSNWSVSGANSKVIVDRSDLTTSTSKTITATVDVNPNRTLTISNIADTTSISLGILDPASTVVFSGLSNMPIPTSAIYGNITFNNTTIGIPAAVGTLEFAGNFTLQGASSFISSDSATIGINLVTYGNYNQLINLNGLRLSVWNFDIGSTNPKTAGTITLAANSTINADNHFIGNMSGSALFVDNGNVITVGNNLDLAGSPSSYNFTGTIWMNGIGTGTQQIRGGASAIPIAAAVNNIVFNSAIIPSKLNGGTFIVKGDLVITDTAVHGLDFNFSGLALGGNFINRNPIDLITMEPTTSTITFNGTSAQTYISAVAGGGTFYNVTMTNSAGLTLYSSMNVSGALALTSGVMSAGTNTVSVAPTGSVSGGNSGSYVSGYFSQLVPSGTGVSKTYEVGDATYSPITLTFPGSITFSGTVTVKSTYGPHPSIATSYVSTSNYVNRYWTIASAGLTVASGGVNVALSYSSGDMTGSGNSNYIIREYTSSAWTSAPSVTNITTGVAPLLADVSKTTGVAASTFGGDYVAGAPDCATSAGTANVTPASLCGSGTPLLSLTGVTTNTGNSYQWLSSPTGSGYTTIAGATTSTYTAPTISSTTYYICTVGCIPTTGTLNSTVAIVTVNPLPSAILGTANTCIGSSQTLSDATGGGTWSSSNASVVTIGTSGTYSGVSAGTSTISYTLPTGCASTAIVSSIVLPVAPVLSSSIMSFCSASTEALLTTTVDTVIGTFPGVNTSTTFVEPKNIADTSSIIVSGIPPGATITSVSVTINIGGTTTAQQKDNILNLRAPNGSILNLVNAKGGAAGSRGFNNVTISSAGTLPIVLGTTLVSGNQYIANSNISVGAITPAGYKSNTTSWSNLYTVPNGQWTFITDNTFLATEDTFKSWSISISYIVYPTITWSPVTGLYTTTSGTAYTGTSTGNIYVLPTVTTIYTVTTTSGACSSSSSIEAYYSNPIYVSPIQGPTAICQGAIVTMTDSLSGGVWSCTGAATVGSTGIFTGSGTGTATVTYSYTNGGCSNYTTKVVTINANPSSISGNLLVCTGANTVLTDAGGGTWSVSNGNASIGTSGIVTGISSGLDTVRFTSSAGCATTSVLTINALPTVSGVTSSANALCTGGTFTLTAGVVSGSGSLTSYNWSGPNGYSTTGTTISVIIAPTVTAASGIYSITVTYPGAGCTSAVSVTSPAVTVNSQPASISGSSILCNLTTISLSDITTGGTWSASNTNVSVGSSGNVTGASLGSSTISYTIGVCYATKTVTVLATPSSITGSTLLCTGGAAALTDAQAGGTWASSNVNVSVDGSGNITGGTAGTSVITYSFGGSCFTTTTVTVNVLPTVSGLAASANVLCAGGTFTLTAGTVSGTGSLISYNWTGPHIYATTGSVAAAIVTPTTTASSGVYSLTVTYPGAGCTSAVSVTSPAVTINAIPTVGGLTSSANALCVGGTFTLTAGATTGAGSLTSYNWSGPNGFNTTGTITTAVLTPTTTAASGVYSLTVTYPGSGCTSATSITSPAVTVNAIPAVSGVTASANALCVGGTFTLTAGTASGTGSLSSYNWSGPNGYNITVTTTTAVVTPTTTASSGIYSLAVTYSGSGCTSTTSVTSPAVTVNALPTVSGVTASANSLCVGGTFTLTSGATSGTGSLSSYNWSGPNGYSAAGTAATAVVTPATIASSGVYSLTVTYPGSGCTSTVSVTSPAVTVNAIPTVGGLTASANALCVGGTFTLTAGATTGAGVLTSYNWSGPNGYNTTGITASAVLTPTTTAASGVYSLTVTYSGSGCTSAISITSPAVTVNTMPTVGGVAASSSALCTGGTFTLTAGAASGTGLLGSYNWSGPNGYNTTGTTASAVITPATTAWSGIYSLTVTYSGSGCTSTASVTSPAVTVNAIPTVSGVTASANSLCVGGTFTLTAGATSGTGSLSSYNWSGPNGYSAAGTAATAVVTPATTALSGVYSLTVTYPGSGCTSTVSVTSPAVTVNVIPTVGGLTASANALCVGGTFTLTAGATTGTGSLSSYNWSGPNGYNTTGIITTAVLTPTTTAASGVYSLTVSYPGSGCTSAVSVTSPAVTVNALPTGGITASANSLCTGGTFTLSAVSVSGSGSLTSYNWSGPNGYAATGTTVSAALTPTTTAASGVYSLMVTYSGSGCTSAVSVTSPAVTVNAIPTVSGVIASPNSLCAQGTFTLTAGATSGVGSLSSYNWSGPNGYNTTGTTASIVLTPTTTTASGVYSLTVSYPGSGCTSAISVTSQAVTVNTQPAVISGSSTLCSSTTVTFSDVTTGGTWAASNPHVTVDGSGNVTGVSLGSSTITYTIGSCFSTKAITINAEPANIIGITTVCIGASTALTDDQAGGTWSSSNGNVTVDGSGNVSASTTGTSVITYSLGGSCLTSTVVTVNNLPTIGGVTASANSLCAGGTFTLTAGLASGTGSLSSYNWSGPNGYITTGVTATAVLTPTTTAASGVYSLSVSYFGSGCTSEVSVISPAVTVNALPTVDGIAASSSALCTGGTFTLTAGAASGTGSLTSYNWSGPNGYIATATVATAVLTPTTTAASGVYSLAVTYPGSGCTSAVSVTSSAITVNALPTVGGVTASSSALCTGGTFTLTAGAASGTGSLTSYYWSGPNGYITTGITASAILTPTTTATGGVYSLTVTYPGSGCTSAVSVTSPAVTVNVLPTVAGVISSSDLLCTGGTFTLTAGAVSGTGSLTSYNWSGPNGYYTTGTDATAILAPTTTAASGVYSLTITYPGSGCTSAVSVTSPAVTVNALPTVGGVTASSSALCTGGTFTLTAGAASGTGSLISYNWSGPDGYNATGIIATAILTPTTTAASGVYSLTVTYPGSGCSSAVSVTTPSVTVNTLPTVGGITSSSSLLCTGGTFTLTAGATSGTGSLTSYNWSGPNGYNTTGIGATAILTPTTTAASGIYSLTVTYPGSGCTSDISVTSAALTVNVLPAVSGVTSSSSLLCTGGTFTLTGGATSGTGSLTSYNWSGPNGYNTTGIDVTAILTPITTAASGVYSLTVTYPGSGCTSAVSVTSPAVTINALPTVSGVTASTDALCAGGTFTLTAGSASGTGSLTSYNWSGPNGYNTTGITATAILTPTTTASSGVYSLTVTYPGDGCTSAVSVTSPAVTVNVQPAAISGTVVFCDLSTVSLSDAVTGGAWSSVSTTVATVDGTSGLVSGVSAGTSEISYTIGSCTSTVVVTVNPLPSPITGTDVVSVGFTITLSDGVTGGTWSSSNGNATIGSSTGVVTGVSAGTSQISYILGSGCTATVIVTVNAIPPAINGILSVCPGTTTTLGDIITGGTWSSSNGNVTIGSSSGIVNGITAGTSIITYTFPSSSSAVYATVTVNQLPAVISGTPGVCLDLTTNLSDATTPGSWSSSNGNATVGSSTGIVTGVTPGIDTVYYTLSSTGCMVSVDVTVNALPASISGTDYMCLGSSTYLTDATTGGSWSSSNTNVTVGSTGIVTGATVGASTITYMLPTGCINTADVTVNSLPDTISGPGNVCAGSMITLTDAGGGTWSSSDSNATINSLGEVNGINPGTTVIIYALPVTGCISVMALTVVPVVTPSVGIIPGTRDTVCAGSTVLLTAMPVNGGAAPAYQWAINSSVTAATSSTYSYVPSNGDIVSVTLTSSAACAVPATAIAMDTITVITLDTPSVHITAYPGDTVCLGLRALFTAVDINAGASPEYIWWRNGVPILSGSSYSFVPANGDNVYCQLISALRCKIADTVSSNHIILNVDSAYIPSVVLSTSNGTMLRSGEADSITAVVSNGGPNVTYQWVLNGSVISGATTNVYYRNNFSNNDSVSCIVRGSGPCGYTSFNSLTIQVMSDGVQQYASGSGFIRLMPNPNKGQFSIKGSLGTLHNEEVVIEITDMLGQVVYKNKIMPDNGNIDQPISFGNTMANGMYILNLSSGGDHKVFHFVVAQ